MRSIGEIGPQGLNRGLRSCFLLIDQLKHKTALAGFKFNGVNLQLAVNVVLLVEIMVGSIVEIMVEIMVVIKVGIIVGIEVEIMVEIGKKSGVTSNRHE